MKFPPAERLIEEWSEKLKAAEEQSTAAQEEAKKLLEQTVNKLVAEKNDTVNKLKDQHRKEMGEFLMTYLIAD